MLKSKKWEEGYEKVLEKSKRAYEKAQKEVNKNKEFDPYQKNLKKVIKKIIIVK